QWFGLGRLWCKWLCQLGQLRSWRIAQLLYAARDESALETGWAVQHGNRLWKSMRWKGKEYQHRHRSVMHDTAKHPEHRIRRKSDSYEWRDAHLSDGRNVLL